MGYGRYNGAWARKASTPTLDVPLKAQPDPEHLAPTDNIDVAVGNPLWVESQAAPMLPDGLMATPFGTPIQAGGGPVDMTPESHDYGPGVSPGLTTAESQALMMQWHEQDDGAVAARQWQPTTDREPGTGPRLAIITDTPLDGDSPQTLELERSGVGTPNDPYARSGKRIKRWWDRVIDMHRWEPQYRPMYARNARTAQHQPAVPNGTQLDSPFATPWPMRATSDAFVAPQIRRTPVPWDQPITGDGTAPVGDFGLTVWGL